MMFSLIAPDGTVLLDTSNATISQWAWSFSPNMTAATCFGADGNMIVRPELLRGSLSTASVDQRRPAVHHSEPSSPAAVASHLATVPPLGSPVHRSAPTESAVLSRLFLCHARPRPACALPRV